MIRKTVKRRQKLRSKTSHKKTHKKTHKNIIKGNKIHTKKYYNNKKKRGGAKIYELVVNKQNVYLGKIIGSDNGGYTLDNTRYLNRYEEGKTWEVYKPKYFGDLPPGHPARPADATTARPAGSVPDVFNLFSDKNNYLPMDIQKIIVTNTYPPVTPYPPQELHLSIPTDAPINAVMLSSVYPLLEWTILDNEIIERLKIIRSKFPEIHNVLLNEIDLLGAFKSINFTPETIGMIRQHDYRHSDDDPTWNPTPFEIMFDKEKSKNFLIKFLKSDLRSLNILINNIMDKFIDDIRRKNKPKKTKYIILAPGDSPSKIVAAILLNPLHTKKLKENNIEFVRFPLSKSKTTWLLDPQHRIDNYLGDILKPFIDHIDKDDICFGYTDVAQNGNTFKLLSESLIRMGYTNSFKLLPSQDPHDIDPYSFNNIPFVYTILDKIPVTLEMAEDFYKCRCMPSFTLENYITNSITNVVDYRKQLYRCNILLYYYYYSYIDRTN